MKLITLTLCITLVFIFFMLVKTILTKHQNNKAKTIFVMMMFSFASLLIELAFIEENFRSLGVYVLSFSGPLSASIPMLFYLYFKSSLNLDSKINKTDLKHLLLPLTYILLMMPYNLLDYEEKIAFIPNTENPWPLSITPMSFTRLGMVIIIGVFYFQLAWQELHVELNKKKMDISQGIEKLKTPLFFLVLCLFFIFILFLFRPLNEFNWLLSLVTIAMLLIVNVIFKYMPICGRHGLQSPDVKTNINYERGNENYYTQLPDKNLGFNKTYRSSVTEHKAADTINNLIK